MFIHICMLCIKDAKNEVSVHNYRLWCWTLLKTIIFNDGFFLCIRYGILVIVADEIRVMNGFVSTKKLYVGEYALNLGYNV